MSNCTTCRYWSEMLAQARGGIVEAMCLNPASPDSMTCTAETHVCDGWAVASKGPVDAPPSFESPYEEGE